MLPWRKGEPTIDDLIRSALNDIVRLIAEPSVVHTLETSRAGPDCEATVLDYLDHNEAGIALEHLIYVVGDADLPIESSTYETIHSAATLMALDPAKHRGIDPRQEPIGTLDQLRAVSHQTYTLAELAGDDAAPLLGLLNHLEPATQARCHTPRHSMVMWGPDLPVAEASQHLLSNFSNGSNSSKESDKVDYPSTSWMAG